MRITFRSGGLTLEGELETVPGAQVTAVVCHPHPRYGGDMNNAVVRAVAAALRCGGCSVLRFNFRGVGSSDGTPGDGGAETDDACAAVRYVREQVPAETVALVGYSFGAAVALGAVARGTTVDCLVAIALPVSLMPLGEVRSPSMATLFVAGEHDDYGPVAVLDQALQRIEGPCRRQVVVGADHFFVGLEREVGERVAAFVLDSCRS
jgi:alpha/beta superfamily hydrolase